MSRLKHHIALELLIYYEGIPNSDYAYNKMKSPTDNKTFSTERAYKSTSLRVGTKFKKNLNHFYMLFCSCLYQRRIAELSVPMTTQARQKAI